MPGDSSDRVTSQNGDRVIFERLAPKVTLKSNCRTQQQQQRQPQQPVLDKNVPSIWKQQATWKSRAGVRDDTKHATEVERASRKLVQATSEADAGTHLTAKEALTDAFSNNEANTQEEIERVTIGSNKILYSRRPSEGEDGVQQRIQPCHFRNRQCGVHGVEEITDSTPIMLTQRFLLEHFSANAVRY